MRFPIKCRYEETTRVPRGGALLSAICARLFPCRDEIDRSPSRYLGERNMRARRRQMQIIAENRAE